MPAEREPEEKGEKTRDKARVLSLRRDDFFEDPRQRLLIYRRRSQEPYAQHRHEFFEIAIVFSGTGEHVTGDYRHTLQSGDVLVINNRRAHGYEKTQNLNLVNLLIRDDLLVHLTKDLGDISGYRVLFCPESARWRSKAYASTLRVSARELKQLEEWIARMEEELAYKQQSSFALAEAYLALIIGILSRRYGKHAEALPKAKLFEELSAWLEERLEQPTSVVEMAAQAKMSQRSFYRTFHDAMGIPPMAYLQNLRLRKAAELLRRKGAAPSVTEVAQLCGFEDSNYFSRCFRKFAGMSPRAFVQAARGEVEGGER